MAAQKLQPLLINDFRGGLVRKVNLADSLVPQNSVSHSINVNFDTTIGKATVRLGTTLLGAQVAANKTPLGLAEFRTAGGGTNLALSVFSGAANASVYYYNGSWNTSGLTTLNNTSKCRFATIANRSFIVNGSDAMKSSADGNTWNTTSCITTDSVTPSLLIRAKSRLLASGDTSTAANRNRSRVWFSSVVDSSGATGTITWDTSATGNWIDINPDDGDEVTALADTSAVTLIFKNNYTYRLFAISKTVDPDPLFNFGAPSQEAVTVCQGIVYFFTGKEIRRTNGSDTSQKISRLVDEILSAVSQSNWSKVSAGNDGTNVYFSLGNVTIPATGDYATTYNNVVLKFSTQDESWSMHSYGNTLTSSVFTNYTITGAGSTNGRQMLGADAGGNVQIYNNGSTDNTTAINFDLQTQEIDFGNRAHAKSIDDSIVVFNKYGLNSSLQVRIDDKDFTPIKLSLNGRVNIGRNISLNGHWFTFRWIGSSTGKSPVLEGFLLENILDEGLIGNDK